jgi:hypothetical protein
MSIALCLQVVVRLSDPYQVVQVVQVFAHLSLMESPISQPTSHHILVSLGFGRISVCKSIADLLPFVFPHVPGSLVLDHFGFSFFPF